MALGVAEQAGWCVTQGHVSGALPPPTYGLRGPLKLSQSTFVPPDQTPYTPSSFSGLDSVPSPPVSFQPPPSPGQSPPSGQARPPTLPFTSQPLRNPSPLPVTPLNPPSPGAAMGATSGTLQRGQHSPKQAGSWDRASGKAEGNSTAPVPPAVDPPAFIGGHGSDSTALHAQQKSSKLVLPFGFQKAPLESPSLTRPGQIIFESSSTVPALSPATPALAPGVHPTSQPVAEPRTAGQAEDAPLPMQYWPSAEFNLSSNAAEQNHLSSRSSRSGSSVQAFLTTQDIAVSGTPHGAQMLTISAFMPKHNVPETPSRCQ